MPARAGPIEGTNCQVPTLRGKKSPPITSWLQDMLDKGYAEPCRGAHVYHVTPHFAVPKPDNPLKMRIDGDFRALNASVEAHSCMVPSIPELWLRTQQHDQTSVVDLEDGYYQVDIPRWTRPYFGFRVGDWYYRYTRLPQGYVNSPKIFIDFVKLMAPKLVEDPQVEVYMDDVVGYGLSPEDLLKKVALNGLSVNHGKTKTTTSPGGAKILGLQIENQRNEVVWTLSAKIVERYEEKSRTHTRLASSRDGLMMCGALQFYRPFLPGLHAWVRPWYDWMKGSMRKTLDRRRTCTLTLPKLKFEIRLPTRNAVQVYTDASEEGTGFAWQVHHRTAMGLFFPARTQAWKRAVGLHREAHGLYTLATRTQGLWKDPMPVWTDSLPLQRMYANQMPRCASVCTVSPFSSNRETFFFCVPA
eukprot:GHVT01054820.1.p1 GENE.GHVT01054820.1~~GHVT01054820.1.p1  ORF type:complete len:415 (-),score=2.15 GHVT01054820.1:134-1378(-)